jgi:hypothetical protein
MNDRCAIQGCTKTRVQHATTVALSAWVWSKALGTHVTRDGKHHGFVMRPSDYSR